MSKSYDPRYKRLYYLNNRETILAYHKQKYQENKNSKKIYAWRSKIARIFKCGLKEAIIQYSRMLASQNGVCAICGKKETKVDRQNGVLSRLCVDHCHRTGNVRGLLCFRCNTNLGVVENFRTKADQYLTAKGRFE